ncbi:MAG: peptidylprolyl isomerase [Terriglobales bacterium]
MHKQFLRIFLALSLLAVVLRADTVVEEIVARVNDTIITKSEFERSREQLRTEVQQQDPANAEKIIGDRDKDVLRDLIDQQLLLGKGKDLGITADTELIKKLDQMRKDMKLDSMEDLEKAAQGQGVSFEDFKNNIRTQIITQQVIGREVGSKLIVSKDDEQQFYDQHKADMAQPEQVKLSEILIATDAKSKDAAANAQLVAAAKAKADDLLDQIKKGASFDDVAKKESDGPSAQQGGELGFFKRGTLAKELEDITFAMKPGDVSNVIQTKQGYIILKVTAHQQAGIPALPEVEARVQDALYMEKLQPALRAYLEKLREDSFIDIRAGYVDTGASPNETQPIETAEKDPNAKQLKKKKKFGLF